MLRRHLRIGLVLFVSVLSPCAVSLACSVSAALASPSDPGFSGAGLKIHVSGGFINVAYLEIFRNGQPWHDRSAGSVGPLDFFYSLQCPLQGEYTWSVVGSCSEPDGNFVRPSVRTTGAYSVPLMTPMDTFSAEVLNPPLANGNVKITYTFPGSAGNNRSIRITPGGQQLNVGQLSGSWVLPLVPGDYTMTAQWCSLGTAGSQRGQAETFKVPHPPPPALFSFAATTTGRVLTHKYRTDDTYPSPLQTEDGKIRVEGLVHGLSGTGIAGRKVYFRLIDPPDTADYVVNNGDAKVDDNVDGPGTLNGGSTAMATSDANGKVSVMLGITDHAAGDNYQVEASLDPDFSCSTAPCRTSSVYTAWKRVYVEMNKMYRRGAFLRKSVMPGAKVLEVSDVRPFPEPPFDLVLVHGPAPGSGTSTFSREVVRIASKTKVPFFNSGPFKGELRLNPDPAIPGVTGSYDGLPTDDSDGNPLDFLADAVAHVTGDRTKDFYLVSGRLVNAAFKNAFVEHVWLTDAGTADPDLLPDQPRLAHDGVVPYVELMNQTNPWQREWMTRKWSHHVGRSGKSVIAKPNHHIVFTASRRFEPNSQEKEYAAAIVAGDSNDLWLWLDRIPAGVEPEAIVHELTHEWRVNHKVGTISFTRGHCDQALGSDQMMALHSSSKCTMTSNMYSEASARDGVVGFHYSKPPAGGPVHSEYVHIRHRHEPIPQNENVRPEPPQ